LEIVMKNKFKIGDHVSWNSEAGRVSGTIVRVHTRNFEVNGYTRHASAWGASRLAETSGCGN
jgi:Hypervirulence associated proteins TUDOR domain